MGWFGKHFIDKVGGRRNRCWRKCDNCGEMVYNGDLKENNNVCPKCEHHHFLPHQDRIDLLVDKGSFEEFHPEMKSLDSLEFVDSKPYRKRYDDAVAKTGRYSGFSFGKGRIAGYEVIFGNLDFAFMGGSMGSVVGEKVAIAAETARFWKIPLILCLASGGARMQEGIYSLMQMAKTSAAIACLGEEGVPYISILTHPTTGGVTASFGMQGDITIAEPCALIGFAGPRVVEQTIRQPLPEGFQRSESNLLKGFVDLICHRNQLKATLRRILSVLAN
ncbi:MAG: acetyl-CoA carboxylase, carboxyltransferase subunit beta [Candidatus Wallbacteria bacterium HGW-Wallbacteria-1]|jgi:acetyl-CoA carboxylase carboxyl transferase subunit beta|uniref:Acetyl-coenzyme A carboxylase carboxyl transferase subunit beta n=1 Tax=Candidatus Wallbacteria bacterium HGW-Wallbacteria-1 TaxID=2013854 RepID=A0A2N1PSE7_9BACT|nr:MAG: acetyl-CoA carboxylase, carboxyltransferase subunit beta [Candidatus Wallbacteria bacterium HGW-Wallbacteria-1]